MKRNKKKLYGLLPLVITLCLYVVFSSRIECKPNHAGFWLVLALGMAVGVAISTIAQSLNQGKNKE